MTVVVDIGCAAHEGQESIPYLLERFQPTVLYGIDPHPDTRCDLPCVVIDRRAAWTRAGRIGFSQTIPATRSFTYCDDDRGNDVDCFDLAEYLAGLLEEYDEAVVVKLDCEGAEYRLLNHLIDEGVDQELELALVEWHRAGIEGCDEMRSDIEGRISCRLEEWAA